MAVVVKRVTPELAEAFLYFFDEVAFRDNPKWASCYCSFYRQDWAEGEWEARSGEQNRREAVEAIRTGDLNGYLAFREDKPVGWVHANRSKHVVKGAEHVGSDGETGVLVCFIVAPEHRGQGIATKLLQAAVEGFRTDDVHRVQAYPRKAGEDVYANYHGPLRMYEEHGFEKVEETDGYYVMQMEIGELLPR